MSIHRPQLLHLAALLFCGLTASHPSLASYTLTQLPTLDGGLYSRATAINNVGQIIGNTQFAAPCFGCGGFTRGTLWSSDGVAMLGGYGRSDYLFDINDSGQVAGTAYIYTGTQAQYWSAGTPYILMSGSESSASGINNVGQVAGTSPVGATIWNGLEGEIYLRPNYVLSSSAVDINDAGQVAGTMDGNVVLWSDGVPVVLGSIGGSYSLPRAINNAGDVIGFSQTTEGYYHATLWDDATAFDLGSLGGNSYAYGINDSGLIVGYAETLQGTIVATLWMDGLTIDLNTLLSPSALSAGWTLLDAVDINNAGQIVGYAWNSISGQYSSYLLTPDAVVPEPSTLALLGLGLAGIALVRRRKR